LVDAQQKAGRRRGSVKARFSANILLVLYALAGGVLIVSAGVLIADVERLWSPKTTAITLLMTATATIICGVCADPILSWFRSSRAGR
jgi:hypothetical protein